MDGRVIDMLYLSRLLLLVKEIIVPSQMTIANIFSLTVTFLKKFIVKKL